MLAKKNRLTKKQFDMYFGRGKRFHSPNLQLIYTPHESFFGAVVVGKKVFKLAVKRNALRRSLYGAMYRFFQQNNKTGVYMLTTKPASKTQARKALLQEAQALFQTVR